jgi:hypothetical protein
MRAAALVAALVAALGAAGALAVPAGGARAQDGLALDPPSREAAQGEATTAPGALLRVLDKINGTLTDLDLAPGETAEVGSLTVTLGECRFPTGNPAGDAFALVSIRTAQDEVAVFEGWLIASAPALNAMDHPRYDVWALGCRGT